jgi:hypothetical protein
MHYFFTSGKFTRPSAAVVAVPHARTLYRTGLESSIGAFLPKLSLIKTDCIKLEIFLKPLIPFALKSTNLD